MVKDTRNVTKNNNIKICIDILRNDKRKYAMHTFHTLKNYKILNIQYIMLKTIRLTMEIAI